MEGGQRPKRHEKGQSLASPSYWPRMCSNSSSLFLVLSNHFPCNINQPVPHHVNLKAEEAYSSETSVSACKTTDGYVVRAASL